MIIVRPTSIIETEVRNRPSGTVEVKYQMMDLYVPGNRHPIEFKHDLYIIGETVVPAFDSETEYTLGGNFISTNRYKGLDFDKYAIEIHPI